MAGPETRERILDAAERLFAGQGFAATSLRTVISEASVNLAAIHYHFGSKEALVRAVFARRLAPLNRERLRRLDDLEAGGGVPSIEDLLDAFIRPTVVLAEEQVQGTPLLTVLLGRLHTEASNEPRAVVYEQFEDIATRFIDAFARALPGLPIEELYTRFHFLIGTMASSFVDPQRLDFVSSGRVNAHDIETVVARMVTFLGAAMRAPATAIASGKGSTVDAQARPQRISASVRTGRRLRARAKQA